MALPAFQPQYKVPAKETNPQRTAVARLTTYCENMISRGKLPMLDEMNLRNFVNEACTAFDMAPCQDRLERDLEAVKTEMEKVS